MKSTGKVIICKKCGYVKGESCLCSLESKLNNCCKKTRTATLKEVGKVLSKEIARLKIEQKRMKVFCRTNAVEENKAQTTIFMMAAFRARLKNIKSKLKELVEK